MAWCLIITEVTLILTTVLSSGSEVRTPSYIMAVCGLFIAATKESGHDAAVMIVTLVCLTQTCQGRCNYKPLELFASNEAQNILK
jgi:hypothetical protein